MIIMSYVIVGGCLTLFFQSTAIGAILKDPMPLDECISETFQNRETYSLARYYSPYTSLVYQTIRLVSTCRF